MNTTIIINQVIERAIYRHVFAAIVSIGICGPFIYMAVDREPPWTRLSGTIEPVSAGGYLTVHWKTTPLVKVCPGTLQVEIISGNLIWPVLQRPVSSSLRLGQVDYTPEPWPVFRDVPPGETTYRVTSFWYCNWLQRFLDWPVIQVGPDIKFLVLPEEK